MTVVTDSELVGNSSSQSLLTGSEVACFICADRFRICWTPQKQTCQSERMGTTTFLWLASQKRSSATLMTSKTCLGQHPTTGELTHLYQFSCSALLFCLLSCVRACVFVHVCICVIVALCVCVCDVCICVIVALCVCVWLCQGGYHLIEV